eukprot:366284-Chlamydomonas_euryale.AAC.1
MPLDCGTMPLDCGTMLADCGTMPLDCGTTLADHGCCGGAFIDLTQAVLTLAAVDNLSPPLASPHPLRVLRPPIARRAGHVAAAGA